MTDTATMGGRGGMSPEFRAYQPHESNRVFTISQKHMFSVHQITNSGGKFIFLARTRTKKLLRMHQKRHFKSIIQFFSGRVPSFLPKPLSPVGRGTAHTLHLSPPPPASLLDPPVRPPDARQIYATDSD